MALKPWYKVVTPREDLRERQAARRLGVRGPPGPGPRRRAQPTTRSPSASSSGPILTKNLTALAAEVLRRLSGETTRPPPSSTWRPVRRRQDARAHAALPPGEQRPGRERAGRALRKLLEQAGITCGAAGRRSPCSSAPSSIASRPRRQRRHAASRKTPWGEIAWQLGGQTALAIVAEHEAQMTAPGGDVIRRMLPEGQPCLILMDELMNYVSRSRKSGLAAQLYNFLHNLSEEARGRDNVVLAVSIPASELEMSAEDQSDYERFKKLLDRLGKADDMSAETETSEIIRRRLFEWDERAGHG